MDWIWLIGLVLVVIAAAITTFYLLGWMTQTRQAFRAAQPDLRITNLSAMSSGDVLTLYPELQNLGGGVALDCTVHLGGWEGNFAIKKVYPGGSSHHNHVASIVLGPDAPIRVKPIRNGYLRIRYLDRWGQKYDRWYPVTQSRKAERLLFDVHIDLEHPDVSAPTPSFWEMRSFLRDMRLEGESGRD